MKRTPGWLKRAVALGANAWIDATPEEHIPLVGYHDPTTLIGKDGALYRTVELGGVPCDTAAPDEIEAWKTGRAQALRQMADPAISITINAVRRQETRQPGGRFADGWPARLNADYMQRWAGRRFYVNTYYITVGRVPETNAKLQADRSSCAEKLTQTVDALIGAMGRYRPRVLTLRQDGGELVAEHLSLLGWLVNGEWRERIVAPRAGFAQACAWSALHFSGDTCRIVGATETRYSAMLGLREYPPATYAGMLDELLEVDAEVTVTQTYRYAPRDLAVEAARQEQRRYELMGDAATSLAAELTDMTDDIASRRVAWGKHHLSVEVFAASPSRLKDAVNDVLARLNAAGASSVRERLNCEPARWAQIPGNSAYIARAGGISSKNLACFASLHDHADGKIDGNKWGPALTVLETAARTPYWFSLHTGDVGHTAIVGTTGAGKTVAVCFLLAQSRRYKPEPRIIVIDKDRSAEITLRAMGGRYTHVQAGIHTGWNPFQLEPTPANVAWLKDFVAVLAMPDGRATAKVRKQIDFAVHDLMSAPKHLRNAKGLMNYINLGADEAAATSNLRAWLHPEGERFWVFGAETNSFKLDDTIAGFDLTAIMQMPAIAEAAMLWLFRCIDERVDGEPTIVYVEEAWSFLRNPLFAQRMEDWLRTWRKKNALVIFVTQGAEDALRGDVGRTLIQNSPTQLIFPSSRLSREQYVNDWKLSPHQYAQLTALGSESRQFLLRKGDEGTILKLDLSQFPQHLAVLSANAERLETMDRMIARYGDDPANWLTPFMELAK